MRTALLSTLLLVSPLFAAEPSIIRSARNGPWSSPESWAGGKVPTDRARVQIRAGHTITYDVKSNQTIRMVHVAGTLTFAHNRDTQLNVGLIRIQTGEECSEHGFDCDAHVEPAPADKAKPALEVGTAVRPIDAKHSAHIRLVYIPGMNKESCPAIVCCGGRMEFHGAAMSRTWVKLGATAKKGDDKVTLAEAVTGWRIGDRILVTATQEAHQFYGSRRPGKDAVKVQTEERKVIAVEGTRLTLDKPLDFVHQGEGEFRGEVANLSRNVVVESADPAGERGHTMYHNGSAGSISYAEFRHLGKEGLLGRYALHYHLCGDTMRGSYVLGASIWDSHNRWLTIHGTDYLVVRDCVGYRSVGHGYFLEDGTEVYNVLDRNLAVQAYEGKKQRGQVFLDDPNDGAGFWWANSLNTFTRNVACENDHYGFRFDATPIVGRAETVTFPVRQPDGSRKKVDIRTLPFVRFEDNEAHCDGRYGFNLGAGVERIGPDHRHPFIIRNTKIWEVHIAYAPSSPSVLVENMKLSRMVYGVYIPNYDHHVYRNLHMSDANGEPFNRGHDDRSIQYGPLTVDGLTFENVRGNPLIQISDNNPTGKAISHFRNVKVVRRPEKTKDSLVNRGVSPRMDPTTPHGVPVYLHDWFGPGRHAKVVSTRAKDLFGDGSAYREEPLLTGNESRVSETRDVDFPRLLDPVDDLPPTTVITHVRQEGDKMIVRGITADNGSVKRVVVNGKEARSLGTNFAEWETTLPANGTSKVRAHAEDDAGNIETRGHEVVMPR